MPEESHVRQDDSEDNTVEAERVTDAPIDTVTEPEADTEPSAEAVSEADADSGASLEAMIADLADNRDLAALPLEGSRGVSVWPFVGYFVVWLIFAGLAVWQLTEVAEGAAVYEAAIYPLVLLGGLVLTGFGPVLIVITWLASRRPGASSAQLFFSALWKGAVTTLAGAVVWWVALLLIDQLRLGSLL